MASKMVWHDSRVKGRAPDIAPNIYIVDESIPIQHSIEWIKDYATMSGGLTDLYVIAHGWVDVYDVQHQQSRAIGGAGIEICTENLNLNNVHLTSAWNGNISVITLYSCYASLTTNQTRNTVEDGERFCMELSAYSGAEVIAAVEAQHYQYSDEKAIDFGRWEGIVFRYSPDGTRFRLF